MLFKQAGFRKKFSTSDHIFSLHVLITIYTKVLKKKLYCCFVDYRKAFDSVPRIQLWYKLLASGVNGNILNVVKSLYSSAKSAVKQNNKRSVFFNCEIGVRQGDNLSPLLFALYLNDLQEHLALAYSGLRDSAALISEWVEDEDTVVYLKLFTILYADDTVSQGQNYRQPCMGCIIIVIYGSWVLMFRKLRLLFTEVSRVPMNRISSLVTMI